VPLALRGYVALPPHAAGDFDHSDVHLKSGRVFVAHTANNTLEVIDGERMKLDETLPGCLQGSGVLCAQGDAPLVFAAARGAGKVLVLDPATYELRNEIVVGPKPNGLAWDNGRQHLLVADVEEYSARLIDPLGGEPDALWFNAARQLLYVAIGQPGLVDVVD
jgi:DNA-binding beta-propeller fold protein YncE